MDRFVLTDAQWAKMEPRCLGKPGDPGRSGKDNRLFVEAVLWIVRTGSPWRDLPPEFGSWNSTYQRFARWSRAVDCQKEREMGGVGGSDLLPAGEMGQALPHSNEVVGSGRPRELN